MSYNILTETAFFKVINDLGGKMKIGAECKRSITSL